MVLVKVKKSGHHLCKYYCPSYRDVRFIEMSVLRTTVRLMDLSALDNVQFREKPLLRQKDKLFFSVQLYLSRL